MPYPPPQAIIRAARRGLKKLHRYAEPEDLEHLRALLAGYAGVPDLHIVAGPGSDMLLREIVHSFSGGRKVVMLSPNFLPTVHTAGRFAARQVGIRLSAPEFRLTPEILLEELQDPALVIIDNPNNPTGKALLQRRTVEAVLANSGTLLVIDEAYFEFSGVSFAILVRDHPNLAITRTLDKAFSLAGARIGYLVAGRFFLEGLSSFQNSLPRASLQAAVEALSSPSYMRENVGLIIAERERLQRETAALGAEVYASAANFLLVHTRRPEIAAQLGERGVLVADISNQLAPGHIRVSVGTSAENDAFIAAYEDIVRNS
jgi:histidinol-phosphate aminotransferase